MVAMSLSSKAIPFAISASAGDSQSSQHIRQVGPKKMRGDNAQAGNAPQTTRRGQVILPPAFILLFIPSALPLGIELSLLKMRIAPTHAGNFSPG